MSISPEWIGTNQAGDYPNETYTKAVRSALNDMDIQISPAWYDDDTDFGGPTIHVSHEDAHWLGLGAIVYDWRSEDQTWLRVEVVGSNTNGHPWHGWMPPDELAAAIARDSIRHR